MSRRGLSLLEMLIVFTLIAVMMALSLPTLNRANAEARTALCRQNLFDISQAVINYAYDQDQLPTLHTLSPTHAGVSLPEFINPRLHKPNAVFCPSDESETSQVLGTSYQWSSTFNGLKISELDMLLQKPMLADREAFHQGAPLPINEMIITQDEAGPYLTLLGEEQQSNTPGNSHRPKLHFKKKSGNSGQPRPNHHAANASNISG